MWIENQIYGSALTGFSTTKLEWIELFRQIANISMLIILIFLNDELRHSDEKMAAFGSNRRGSMVVIRFLCVNR